MNTDALNSALSNLFSRSLIERSKQPDSLFSYRFVYTGRLTDEEINVVPAITKDALKRIVLGAINGNIPDMTTVSMLYAAGFGLERNPVLAECWSAFAMLQPAPVCSYSEAIAQLKTHYNEVASNIKSGFIWPQEIQNTIDTVLSKCNVLTPYTNQVVERGALVTPNIAGIRVNLVYRAYKMDGELRTHLYAAFYHVNGEVIYGFDELRLLNIPLELGMHGPKRVIINYAPFGDNVKLYLVQGFLTVPKPLRAELKENFPKVHNVSDLFSVYRNSLKQPRLTDFSFVLIELKEKLRNLKAEYSALGTVKSKKAQAMDEKIAKLEKKLGNESRITGKAKAEYEKKNPERYLQFVASTLFVYQNGKLLAPQQRIKPAVSLQSLGFKSFYHPVVDLVGYQLTKEGTLSGLDNILHKFEKAFGDQYTVTGLNIRPSAESVKIKRCFTYSKKESNHG